VDRRHLFGDKGAERAFPKKKGQWVPTPVEKKSKKNKKKKNKKRQR